MSDAVDPTFYPTLPGTLRRACPSGEMVIGGQRSGLRRSLCNGRNFFPELQVDSSAPHYPTPKAVEAGRASRPTFLPFVSTQHERRTDLSLSRAASRVSRVVARVHTRLCGLLLPGGAASQPASTLAVSRPDVPQGLSCPAWQPLARRGT